jgi:hypothetical protein
MTCLTRSPVSGGFAVVQPDSTLSINAVRPSDAFRSMTDRWQVEGFPLEDFSAEVSSPVNWYMGSNGLGCKAPNS